MIVSAYFLEKTGRLKNNLIIKPRVQYIAHGVLYFKYFSVLLQEMSIEIDSEFIFAIIDFVDLDVEGWNEKSDDRYIFVYYYLTR